jgi:4-hydroxy-tetrahydrodipicolinate reductase
MLNMVIPGASGRMGKMLIEAVLADPAMRLHAALDVAGSPALGQDAAAFLGQAQGVLIGADIATAVQGASCLIDFTRPEGTLAHLDACVAAGVNMVIGTTGFDAAQKTRISEAAQHIGIVFAPNMSVGVNVTLKLLEKAAKALATGYDIEIIEAHHKHKVDAPSGTALKMGEVIADTLGLDLNERGVFARHGHTGARQEGTIGFSTVRGGDIVGDHTVLFAGTGERIEISHKSSSRAGYAAGSLRAAHFLATQGAGLYDMFDVLHLSDL